MFNMLFHVKQQSMVILAQILHSAALVFYNMQVLIGLHSNTFTSGSRGRRTRRALPPNGRGPMIFYAQNTKFSPFFTLASLAIHVKHHFNRNVPKTG